MNIIQHFFQPSRSYYLYFTMLLSNIRLTLRCYSYSSTLYYYLFDKKWRYFCNIFASFSWIIDNNVENVKIWYFVSLLFVDRVAWQNILCRLQDCILFNNVFTSCCLHPTKYKWKLRWISINENVHEIFVIVICIGITIVYNSNHRQQLARIITNNCLINELESF